MGALKELTLFSTSPLEEAPSATPVHSQKVPPPAPIDTAIDAFRVPISSTSIILPLVFKFSDYEKIEYRVDVLNATHPVQPARLTDPDYVEKVCTMVREGR